jgi:hypothetical protein
MYGGCLARWIPLWLAVQEKEHENELGLGDNDG